MSNTKESSTKVDAVCECVFVVLNPRSDIIFQHRNVKSYDVYHDANISETMLCRPILDKFMERVQELLSDWPDHPTLKQVHRLLSIAVKINVTCYFVEKNSKVY